MRNYELLVNREELDSAEMPDVSNRAHIK